MHRVCPILFLRRCFHLRQPKNCNLCRSSLSGSCDGSKCVNKAKKTVISIGKAASVGSTVQGFGNLNPALNLRNEIFRMEIRLNSPFDKRKRLVQSPENFSLWLDKSLESCNYHSPNDEL